MTDKIIKKDGIEVSSQSLQAELVAIKDRLNAIETIQSVSNAETVKKYVYEHLRTRDAKLIMRECEEPKTRSQLQSMFSYRSKQALDHHLKPLRESDLLRQNVEEDGTILFGWSNLFRGLPKSTKKSILAIDDKATNRRD